MCFSEATSTIKSSIGILGFILTATPGVHELCGSARGLPWVLVILRGCAGPGRGRGLGSEPGTESGAEPGSEPGSEPGAEGPGDRSVGYHLVGYAGEYRIEFIENGLPVIGFPEHNEHGVVSSDCSGHR